MSDQCPDESMSRQKVRLRLPVFLDVDMSFDWVKRALPPPHLLLRLRCIAVHRYPHDQRRQRFHQLLHPLR
eukprot:12389753-Prorocentrum_lima.AAC.1